ncbi:hypothetical protein [Runella aurantiaca]|uniref:Uncharacterized protein n=1 Tax=Runella aurantiaca TaxID=2282308 RepID=A0A369IDK3_9BACT|nr:hypothetical protein [Runella aurantiaca]RDB06507.1 hypothetical protein DVG78_07090 [Runella aurantiaca]
MKYLFLLLPYLTCVTCFGKIYLKTTGFKSDTLKQEATIRFEVKNVASEYVVLYYSFNSIIPMNDTLVIKGGVCEKKYHLSKPVYMDVSGRGFYGRIYLAPSFQSTVIIDGNNRVNRIVSFKSGGDGALANDYLNEMKTISTLPRLATIGKMLTEQQYLEMVERHYSILDSVYITYHNRYDLQANRDVIMQSFFDTEKMDLRFRKGGTLLNFMEARRYRGNKAEAFFAQYIQPLNLQKEEINLLSNASILFFKSYLPTYFMVRVRESSDSTIYQKIGHYAYILDYVTKNYQGQKRAYCIAENLYFLADQARSYPAHFPPIDSLMKAYDSYLTDEWRELIWKT